MPILDSLGSARGFGFIGKVFRTLFSDNFSRSGALGDPWILTRGTWTANGSQATSSDSASTNPIAVVDNFPSTVSTARISIPDGNGGVGLSFWVTDANSWWAVYPSYAQQTVNNCSSYTTTVTSSSNCCGPAGTQKTLWNVACFDGDSQYCSSSMNISIANSICGSGNVSGWNSIGSCWDCKINETSTQYSSSLNLASNSGIQNSLVYSTSQSYPRTYSVVVSLNGNTVTYTAYSAADGGGSVLGSTSSNVGAGTKGSGIGLFKGTSSNFQGSNLDTFYVSA
jgi:hypothetical protein